LAQAKNIVDAAFSSEGTDWFRTEQMDLHDASSAMARLLDSLRQETPVKAIASRIMTAAWQDRLPKGVQEWLKRRRNDKNHPDIPENIRHVTDWDEVARLLPKDGSEEHSDVPEDIRHITDWGRVKKLVKNQASQIVESCSTCGCGFSAPMSLNGFQEGDRVRRKPDGMEGTVYYVGSGPKGDSLSVLWDNPAQRIMGPDIVKPGTVEKA